MDWPIRREQNALRNVDFEERWPVVGRVEATAGDFRVVLEDEQPLLAACAAEQHALRFERDERLDVVAHDPGQR